MRYLLHELAPFQGGGGGGGGGGEGGRDMRADSTSPGGEGRPEFFRVILSHDHSMFDLRKACAE